MTSKKGVICGFWWETNLFRQIRFGWVHFCYNTSWVVVGYSAASNVIIILCYLVVCISLVLRLLKRCNATTVRCKSRSQGSRSRDEEEETNPNEMEDFISWQEKWTQYQQPKKNCKIGGHFHFFLFFFQRLLWCAVIIKLLEPVMPPCYVSVFPSGFWCLTRSAQGTVSAVDDERSSTSFVSFTSPNEVNSTLTCATSASQRKVKKHLTLLILIRSHHLKMLRITVPHIQPLLR